jgi:hypothetical protein
MMRRSKRSIQSPNVADEGPTYTSSKVRHLNPGVVPSRVDGEGRRPKGWKRKVFN